MTAYKCTAWVKNSDGVRRPEVTETIAESELSQSFVIAARTLFYGTAIKSDMSSWLAACEFARRSGLEPKLWQVPPNVPLTIGGSPNPRAAAREAQELPIIIRVEAVP